MNVEHPTSNKTKNPDDPLNLRPLFLPVWFRGGRCAQIYRVLKENFDILFFIAATCNALS